jgi:hypothetical protein
LFRRWGILALLNLLIVALAGLFLRLLHIYSLPKVNYEFMLHAHSHFAFAGWGFLALYTAFVQSFIPEKISDNKSYKAMFWLMQIAAFGMLFSFPFEGYAGISISFSTLFVFVSYWFSWRFFKDTKPESKNLVSVKFAKAGLIFLVISSIGPFALGPIMANGGRGSHLYFNALYFYLHFQYNGWFSFGVFALLFRWMDQKQLIYSKKSAILFYRLTVWACVPAFLLSVLWIHPDPWVYFLAGIGGVIQATALIPFWKIVRECNHAIGNQLSKTVKVLFSLSAALFTIKLTLQLLSAIPIIAQWAYEIRNFVIGYLHLVLLGFITLFLLALFIEKRLLVIDQRSVRWGLGCFVVGILITELLIFSQGFASLLNIPIPNFNGILFFASVLLPAGLVLILYGQFRKKLN